MVSTGDMQSARVAGRLADRLAGVGPRHRHGRNQGEEDRDNNVTSCKGSELCHSTYRLGGASFRWEQAMGIELNVTRCDVMRRKVDRGTGVWIMQGAAQPCGLQFQGLRLRPGNALESESA
jgi:hypothetical protein